MKKYIVPILFVAVFVCFSAVYKFNSKAKTKTQEYLVYVTNMSEVEITDNCKVLDFGFCFEVSSDAEIKTRGTKSTLGRSKVLFCEEQDVNKILKQNGFTEFNRYKIDNVLVFEGRMANGKKAQVAFCNKRLTIGSPVIFGSY